MDLQDRDTLYRAMLARDRRYDGRFYVGVQTTGIYCRPICPARPKLENCHFYRSQAEAEGAGYRPCLRCRPDLSPNSRQWAGTAAVVGRALTLISQGEADDAGLDQLASRLGMSDRHLRRLFEEHLGASPLEVATSRRLHLARQLLLQTGLPVTEVALAAGFQSIRRFNAAFKATFKSTPSEMRRVQPDDSGRSDLLRLELPYLEPFDWSALLTFLGRHQVTGVEQVEGGVYRRVFAVGDRIGTLEVRNHAGSGRLELHISAPDVRALRGLIERTRDLFDLRMNPALLLERTLEGQTESARPEEGSRQPEVMALQPGIRIPGCWDPFETAVGIIVGQLVSVEAAQRMMGRMVATVGTPLAQPPNPALTHLFPSPEVLARADLSAVGLTRVKAGAVSSLAQAVLEGELDLSRACDLPATREKLLSIRGIGPWTVEMVAMRCLNDTDAFPESDLIIRRALELLGLDAGEHAPFRAYLALALWQTYAGSLSNKRRARGVEA